MDLVSLGTISSTSFVPFSLFDTLLLDPLKEFFRSYVVVYDAPERKTQSRVCCCYSLYVPNARSSVVLL